jgi:hypothetical protein
MDIFNLLSYKLENFLNIRPYPKEPGTVFYEEDEPCLLSVAARKKSNGAPLFATRWELFLLYLEEPASGHSQAEKTCR